MHVVWVLECGIQTLISHRPPFLFWTNGAPHQSGFKFHIIALSLLCAMFLVHLFFSKESIDCFHDIIYRLLVPWSQWLLLWQSISYFTFAKFLYLDFYILISFHSPFILHSYPMVLLRLLLSEFFLVSNYHVWLVGQNLSVPLDSTVLLHLHIHKPP
jgi:hypothetical protein